MKPIDSRSIPNYAILVLALVTVFGLLLTHFFVVAAISNDGSLTVLIQVPISTDQSMQVLVPSSSNITLLSVSGSGYDVSIHDGLRTNLLLFSASDINTTYFVEVNISSFQPTYAVVSALSGLASTEVKNVTSSGNLILDIMVSITQPVSQGSEWNPLSGFTGLSVSFGGINLDTADVLTIFLGITILLIGMGARFNQKILFLGIVLLSIIGLIQVGILGVGLALGAYFLSFFALRSYFGYRARRDRGF